MFILRTISKNQLTNNTFLGEKYSINYRGDDNGYFKAWYRNYEAPNDNIYAIVSNREGKIIPLFWNEDNYIMTDSGKTFEKIRCAVNHMTPEAIEAAKQFDKEEDEKFKAELDAQGGIPQSHKSEE